MNIGIIGLGLIGGSLGRAIVKKTAHTVYGADISPIVCTKAELLDTYHFPLTDADYAKLDILCIAVYPRSFNAVLSEALPKLSDGATIIDIAGLKRQVVADMERAKKEYPKLQFVATHPMAGREFWGIEHSTAGLFEKASLIMLPVHTDISELTAVKGLFTDIGVSNVVFSDSETHDKMIAYTSQLAHVVSSSYVKSPSAENHDGFSAGSFRDLTRVAQLNTKMWTELLTDNSDNLVREIDILIENLSAYREALVNKDEVTLARLLEEGNNRKEAIEKATRSFKRNN